MQALAPFCTDELTHIIRFLPYYDQMSCIEKHDALIAEFSSMTQDEYLSQSLEHGPAATIKQAVEQGINELLKDHPRTAALLPEENRERLCRLIVVGLTNDSPINKTEMTVCSGDFGVDFAVAGSKVIEWAMVFKTVKRLEVRLDKEPAWLPILLFIVQCMPRITHLAFHQEVDLVAHALQFENSVVKNRWFRWFSMKPIKVGWINGRHMDKIFTDGEPTSRDYIQSLSCYLLGKYSITSIINDLDTLKPFYAPEIKCKRLEMLLGETIILLHEDRLRHMLALVTDCDYFDFGVKSWLRLVQDPLFRPVYEAIVDKVQRGQTKYSCRARATPHYLVKAKDFLDFTCRPHVLIELAKSGIDIETDTVPPRTMSPILAYELMTHGVRICHGPQMAHFLGATHDLYLTNTPMGQYMMKQSRIHTMSTLSKADTMEALVTIRSTWLLAFLNQVFEGDFVEHIDEVRCSIHRHPAQWKMIVSELFQAKQTFVLQHLLHIAHSDIKQHLLVLVSQIQSSERCHMFETWLHHHNLIDGKDILHSETMACYAARMHQK